MKRIGLLILLGMMLCLMAFPVKAQTAVPTVRAILFYSPTCGHCHTVINEVLPPLFDQYGEQLKVMGVDISTPGGQELFFEALAKFELDQTGVPFLVIGDGYLYGSQEIPEKLPGLIEQYLAQGGIDWPDIPGLAEALAYSGDGATPQGADSTPAGLLDTFRRDVAGNSLALIVLLAMIISIILAVILFKKLPARPLEGYWSWAILLICLIGVGVAGYMSYIETTQVEAVCGPVGDCNAVQQSSYARLFGVLPIGILGLIGYALIILAWFVAHFRAGHLANYAALSLAGLSTFGLLFSIYLTFLEPFVIGASCAWCLTSAVLMTALFWLTLPSAKWAAQRNSQPV